MHFNKSTVADLIDGRAVKRDSYNRGRDIYFFVPPLRLSLHINLINSGEKIIVCGVVYDNFCLVVSVKIEPSGSSA